MTQPGLLFSRFITACLLGAGLGVCYDFLHPGGKRAIHIRDGLFLPILFAFGIYLGFGVCQGDLRLVYSFGLLLGALAWHFSLGRLFRPLISRIFHIVFLPLKKFFQFLSGFWKKTIAIAKKWSTINIMGIMSKERQRRKSSWRKRSDPTSASHFAPAHRQ